MSFGDVATRGSASGHATEGASTDRLSLGVAARLSRYLQVLTQARKMGKETISSQELSEYTHVNSTQIRRDLSGFGKFGKRGVGYNVDSLVSQIRKILRTSGQHNIALFGAGHLGRAIASSDIFADHGFRVVAMFDTDRSKIGEQINGVGVRHIDDLKQIVEEEDIVVGVLAVPTAAAHEIAEGSDDFTVGIEEEFALVDPETLLLVPRFELLRDAAAGDPVLSESIAGELISSEIEIRSGAGSDVEDARARQADVRRRLFTLAREHGVALGATGTHPLSDYREQHIIDTEHYHRVEEGLKYVAWRNNTFSVHVHVGVRGADRAVRVCDRLRPVLPLLLAVSANSPYIDGRDSGLHSGRSQTFTKSFPRCGIPDVFGSWRAWADYVEVLVRTGSIVEFTQLWWSVRPHHDFGTVEVRICDAQMTAPESDGLAELIVACVRRAVAEVDAGDTPPDLPARLIEEFPASETLDRLNAWSGADVVLPELNGAQRQRRMIEAGATPAEVYAACLAETQATYFEETS